MSKIVIYQKPTCTTCRQVSSILKEQNVPFEAVDYYLDPIPKGKLKELTKKMGIAAKDLFRTKEDIYKKLDLAKKQLSEEEALDLMVKYPDLIERPIAEKGAKAILARPAEAIRSIL